MSGGALVTAGATGAGASIEWTRLCLGHNLRKWARAAGLSSPLARLRAWLRRAHSLLWCSSRATSSETRAATGAAYTLDVTLARGAG